MISFVEFRKVHIMKHRCSLPLYCISTFAFSILLTSPLNALPTEASLANETAPAYSIWADTLAIDSMHQGYGHPQKGKSVEGNPITFNGQVFPHGIGTHATSVWTLDLHGQVERFSAMAGVDDEAGAEGSVEFKVIVDGQIKAKTGIMHKGDKPQFISVDVAGARQFMLLVTDAGDGAGNDHADWAGALFTMKPGSTQEPSVPAISNDSPRLVIPAPNPKPVVHGPRITGATPGYDFLFKIPVTGEGPFTYTAQNLPSCLKLDKASGIISGSLKKEGVTRVHITVKGAKGNTKRDLVIVGGKNKLALTPPMGWNSWNVWAWAVDDSKVRAAADDMIKSGLADYGYQYINIDDCWQGNRDASGEVHPNEKFPNMPELSKYIHQKGLKFGIYSSPGPKTCAGFEGSYKYEVQDALTYAKWGVDYLKYDWCSYGGVAGGNDLEHQIKPYSVMNNAFKKAPRDIIYSFCQYGMGDVWKWGAENGGNCWRTTGDINDSWGSMYSILEQQIHLNRYAGPGHWNDPDMMIVGNVGWGANTHPTHLLPNEQIVHVSMWCMLSSPLLIGCDMSKLDEFTKALLTNDELLDINQDPMGKSADIRVDNGLTQIWSRPLSEGTTAVAIINSGFLQTPATIHFSDIGVKGKQPIRDLWLHKNMGLYENEYNVTVPAHGCVVLKIGKSK